jgi:nitrogen fixation protein NifQ
MRVSAIPVLMSCADSAGDPTALAMAGVMGHAWDRHGLQWLPMPGLDALRTRAVLARWFAGADGKLGLDWAALEGADRVEPRRDEIDDLLDLLIEHADLQAGPALDARAVALALACASLGEQHLWQDLHLPSRRELSALIGRWFPALAARNTHDMKWKKFFYKQLCLREELFICKAPSCGECNDHAVCFGPEDAAVTSSVAAAASS